MNQFLGGRRLAKLPARLLAAAGVLAMLLGAPHVLEARARAVQKKPAPLGTLSGTVLGPNGKPAARARVHWQTSDGRAPRYLRADSQGHFQFTCPAGPVEVRARAGGKWSEWLHNVPVKAGTTSYITIQIED